MTAANKIIFFLLCACLVVSTLAYGTVHQPTIALFYFVIAGMLVIWAVDGFASGSIKFSRSLIQLPIYLAAVYAFVQIIPFGTVAETAADTR